MFLATHEYSVIEKKNREKQINREYYELYVLLKLSPGPSAAL
jgi:hypothetical protein